LFEAHHKEVLSGMMVPRLLKQQDETNFFQPIVDVMNKTGLENSAFRTVYFANKGLIELGLNATVITIIGYLGEATTPCLLLPSGTGLMPETIAGNDAWI